MSIKGIMQIQCECFIAGGQLKINCGAEIENQLEYNDHKAGCQPIIFIPKV